MQTNKLLALKMTENHSFPITPTPELVQQWTDAFWNEPGQYVGIDDEALATRAAQWGADQELDACCEWLKLEGHEYEHEALLASRRPKPPSLKEKCMKSLDNVIDCIKSLVPGASVDGEDIQNIRRALEQLPE